MEKTPMQKTLAEYLTTRSEEICRLNDCTDDDHNCGSYAYVRRDMQLLDICSPDYFTGCGSPHAAIPLPWNGTQTELETQVNEQCEED